jgi:hypothetical protein
MKFLSLAGCLLVLLAATAAGCRTVPPPPPPRVPVASAQELIALLEARQAGLQTFQARGRLTLLTPEQRYSGSGRLRGSLPSTLRVDVLDFFGRSLINFASDGQEVEVLFPREGKMLYGPATPQNLAAFLPPGVTLPQALKVITGDLPLSPGEPAEWRYEPGQNAYFLEWRNPDDSPTERLWVDAGSLHPAKVEWHGGDGRLVFSAELRDFVRDRPQQITFKTVEPETELRLALHDVQLNPTLSPAELKISPVQGVEKIPFRP